jgi:RNA polymerase sigma-70 factor (ECF subfamily)
MKEFDEQLQKAIASLPEKCRTIYLMSRMDGKTYTEIAENLGVSIKAVEKQISKALSIFREVFEVRL